MSLKKQKQKKARGKTAIVPQVVFGTVIAAVVPVLNACSGSHPYGVALPMDASYDASRDAGVFSVAMRMDAQFSVVAPLDSGFGVADAGTFSVVAIQDGGAFSVAIPLDATFSVVIAPLDGSAFG